MRLFRHVVPVSGLLSVLLLWTSVSFGKPEYTKKEKRGCVVCHAKAGSKDLNAVGKCYKQQKSLERCETKQ